MIENFGLEYVEVFLKTNTKLTKLAQDEIKELLLREIVNKLCEQFIDAKNCNNNTKAIKISNKMKKLHNSISIFDKIKCSYYNMFLIEIEAYSVTNNFVNLVYNNNGFDDLHNINIIYQ